MKEKLKKLLAKKNERKNAIVAESAICEDVAALRTLNKEMDDLNAEIRSLQEMLLEEPGDGTEPAQRTQVVNGEVPGVVVAGAAPAKRKADDSEPEYRKAFMDYVTGGVAIPAELRAAETTKTSDIGSAIPTVLVNKIVEKLESTGMILPLVSRTAFAPGVDIPTSSVKPVATWVAEGKGSDKQKKTTGVITFTHHKLRCEIAMTMEAGTMALSAFESSFVRQVTEAMLKAIEQSILTGAGTSSPKGILIETPELNQALTASTLDYRLLVDAEAAIPQAYEGGAVWCMTKKTFMGFIGMVDSAKQPIARVTYGIANAPERSLLGRTVVLCGDYMESYSDTLETGKIFAFLFKFADYTLNTVYDMGVQRKQDWDTEDMLTKAVMACDGKVIDKRSLVTIAKATTKA